MRRLFLGALHHPNPLLSEALGAPGSPRRTPDFLLRSTRQGRVCGFLRRNKCSIRPRLVFVTAGSTTKRRVPHPLRSLQRVG
jgi:hypothetical protein